MGTKEGSESAGIIDSDPNTLWKDALNVTLATHPRNGVQAMTSLSDNYQLVAASKALPPDLLVLIRRCVDVVIGDLVLPMSQLREIILITLAMLKGKNPEFDVLIEARVASMERST